MSRESKAILLIHHLATVFCTSLLYNKRKTATPCIVPNNPEKPPAICISGLSVTTNIPNKGLIRHGSNAAPPNILKENFGLYSLTYLPIIKNIIGYRLLQNPGTRCIPYRLQKSGKAVIKYNKMISTFFCPLFDIA